MRRGGQFLLVLCLSGAHLFCTGAGLSGASDDEEDQQLLLLAALALSVAAAPNATMAARAATGVSAWQIGLPAPVTAAARSLGSSTQSHSPAHWITTSGTDCVAGGVPDSLVTGCKFTEGVIGVCQVRWSGSQPLIVDTTVLISLQFQNGSTSEAEKTSVFVHEVGHCLGLKHTDSSANVMFPNTSGANLPSSGELAAVREAYVPIAQPSAATTAAYFSTSGGNAVRHGTLPQFTVAVTLGKAALEQVEPGRRFAEPLFVRTSYLYGNRPCRHD